MADAGLSSRPPLAHRLGLKQVERHLALAGKPGHANRGDFGFPPS